MKKLSLMACAAVLSLGLFGCTSSSAAESAKTYANGTYRGGYLDGSVEVQLTLEDNIVTEAKYRKLQYKDTDFLAKEGTTKVTEALKSQYSSLLDHLVGKDITVALEDLYTPGNIAADVDGLASASVEEGQVVDAVSGATIRSGKIISSINDALNRGAYSLPKEK